MPETSVKDTDLSHSNSKSPSVQQPISSASTNNIKEEKHESIAGPSGKPAQKSPNQTRNDKAIQKISNLIKSGKAKKIVILAGAGISTSAGIPDFRSPTTGLYANLQQLKLPRPEAVFDLDFFEDNPQPFWTLAKELYPLNYYPTPTHYFFELLEKHKVLQRVFTQNIDTLEHLTGLSPAKLVEAHGSFAGSHCLKCRRLTDQEYVMKVGIEGGEIVRCQEKGCGGLVKPDIVFFGESLPEKFFDCLSDLGSCDLLIVIGTSLSVMPFSSLVDRVPRTTPRILINREAVGPFTGLGAAKNVKEGKDGRDSLWLGDADDGVVALADALGWGEELRELRVTGTRKLDRRRGKTESGGAEEEDPVDTDVERLEAKLKEQLSLS